jgi:hypothetical protein
MAASASIPGTATAATTILSFGGSPGVITWSKNSGANGRLFAGTSYGGSTLIQVTAPPSVAESTVAWSFSADFVAGSSKWLINTSSLKIKAAEFNNGVFSFAGTNGDILSGTFASGILVSNNGALSMSVGDALIRYSGGLALKGLGTRPTGNLTIGISGTGLPTGWNMNTAGNITTTGFSGNASGTLDATTGVPEPAEWASIGTLATTLVGLTLRAKRRRQKPAL